MTNFRSRSQSRGRSPARARKSPGRKSPARTKAASKSPARTKAASKSPARTKAASKSPARKQVKAELNNSESSSKGQWGAIFAIHNINRGLLGSYIFLSVNNQQGIFLYKKKYKIKQLKKISLLIINQ